MAANYFVPCQNLELLLVDLRLKTKTDLLTLILLNGRDLSKMKMLQFVS